MSDETENITVDIVCKTLQTIGIIILVLSAVKLIGKVKTIEQKQIAIERVLLEKKIMNQTLNRRIK